MSKILIEHDGVGVEDFEKACQCPLVPILVPEYELHLQRRDSRVSHLLADPSAFASQHQGFAASYARSGRTLWHAQGMVGIVAFQDRHLQTQSNGWLNLFTPPTSLSMLLSPEIYLNLYPIIVSAKMEILVL